MKRVLELWDFGSAHSPGAPALPSTLARTGTRSDSSSLGTFGCRFGCQYGNRTADTQSNQLASLGRQRRRTLAT